MDKLTAGDLVSHKGKIYEVVGMIGPGLVKISRHDDVKTVRLNQVSALKGKR